MAGEARFTGTLTLPAGGVRDSHIASNAAIDVDKMQHCTSFGTCFGFAIGGTPTTREEIVHVCGVSGTIRGFHAALNDTGTSTGITFDLKKNGSTVLSATADITHADTDRQTKDGTISSASVSAGDVLSILMTVTSSTGAQGPYSWVVLEENSAPS